MKNWNWKKITAIFIAIGIVVALGYDVLVINMSSAENSISQVIIDWAYEFPVFTFCAGALCGHLFWQMGSGRKNKKRVKELEEQLNALTSK